jgi:protease IV
MVAFLRWARSILFGTLNAIAKVALFGLILVIVLTLIGFWNGDGLPRNIVLALDLRQSLKDSAQDSPFVLGPQTPTVMDIVLALDQAAHDSRVKGVVVRVGEGDLSVAQAEEISAALKRFRTSGKFVIAHAQGFVAPGLGDYLVAAAADQIWMQPKSPFSAAGAGGGELFLRGLFDKIGAEPQIAKRAEYKSAADMFMEKGMTPADREQLNEVMRSWYDAATGAAASDRKLSRQALAATLEASPQFTDDVRKAGLIDRVGYDDDASSAAIGRAGSGAKTVKMSEYVRARLATSEMGSGPQIAVVEASGEIVDGTAGDGLNGGTAIGGDELSRAIRQAASNKDIKAIVLRVDSPGGSVTASDQILNAVKKAQAKGKPVIVSMGAVAASGGYYISSSANEIVAEPGTLTGSIGVLTGKVSFGKSLGLLGVGTGEVSIGKNTLFDSAVTPFTPEQWAILNREADMVYADFTQKVATGRKMPLAKVQDVAKGRVWTGADANARGLVDRLGGFWTAIDAAKKLARIAPDTSVVFKKYPRPKSFFQSLNDALGGTEATARTLQGLSSLMNAPPLRAILEAQQSLPRNGIALKATNLPGAY